MVQTIFKIDCEAKITTTNGEIHENEYSLKTRLDLGIEEEKDWLDVDEGMIYSEAFKEAMSTFFEDRLYKDSTAEIKEATITIKKLKHM